MEKILVAKKIALGFDLCLASQFADSIIASHGGEKRQTRISPCRRQRKIIVTPKGGIGAAEFFERFEWFLLDTYEAGRKPKPILTLVKFR